MKESNGVNDLKEPICIEMLLDTTYGCWSNDADFCVRVVSPLPDTEAYTECCRRVKLILEQLELGSYASSRTAIPLKQGEPWACPEDGVMTEEGWEIRYAPLLALKAELDQSLYGGVEDHDDVL